MCYPPLICDSYFGRVVLREAIGIRVGTGELPLVRLLLSVELWVIGKPWVMSTSPLLTGLRKELLRLCRLSYYHRWGG